ncbi:MAG: hypothetical protein OXH41_13530 [Chloroflexi bacterium]|nr:hypothetical protein [Chloroflexota bacterium]
MVARYVHPFPARMAPQLALDALKGVRRGARVLDPMCGSGTVLQAAMELGLDAIGRDVDPLAVLMSRVATTRVDPQRVLQEAEDTLSRAQEMEHSEDLAVREIDGDAKALAFVRFWYAGQQERQLRALTRALPQEPCSTRELLRLAVSRTIVTKDRGASLARDVSHSRPHKVATDNEFDVGAGFMRSVKSIIKAIDRPLAGTACVELGDARNLSDIGDETIGAVVTSPPYLNAIDYMRGHRLALIWLGVPFSDLALIRSSSIGAERAPDASYDTAKIDALIRSSGSGEALDARFRNMFRRFVGDIDLMQREVSRVLEADGTAVVVIGNSTIRGTFVDNAGVVAAAGRTHGLRLDDRFERELPSRSRYLPPPEDSNSSLSRRMRTETILTFGKES